MIHMKCQDLFSLKKKKKKKIVSAAVVIGPLGVKMYCIYFKGEWTHFQGRCLCQTSFASLLKGGLLWKQR